MIATNFTLEKLINLLSQHYGVTVETFPVPDEDGQPVAVRTLVREYEGFWFSPLGILQDGAMLDPDVIRSICAQLGVPSLEFGIPLDWDET